MREDWIDRYAAEGEAGLAGPFVAAALESDAGPAPRSRHGSCERAPASARGPDWLGAELGSGPDGLPGPGPPPAPAAGALDPITGQVIRATKATAVRYERDRPGELVHMDVKKIGKIPDGGGWRAHGRDRGRAPARPATTGRVRLRALPGR